MLQCATLFSQQDKSDLFGLRQSIGTRLIIDSVTGQGSKPIGGMIQALLGRDHHAR